MEQAVLSEDLKSVVYIGEGEAYWSLQPDCNLEERKVTGEVDNTVKFKSEEAGKLYVKKVWGIN